MQTTNLDPTKVFKKPYVKLYSEMDARLDCWRHSRPHLSESDTELFLYNKTDLPVQGFKVVALTFYCSTAFRDMLYMIRPQVGAWAQSNRTIDMTADNIFMADYIREEDKPLAIKSIETFMELKSKGVTQDEAKGYLNQAHLVYADVVMDLRTIMNFIYTLKVNSQYVDYYSAYGKQLEEIFKDDIESYPTKRLRDLWADMQPSSREIELVESGNVSTNPLRFYTIGGRVKSVLHSQMIRKMYNTVVSDSITKLISGEIYSGDQNQEFSTILYLDKTAYDAMTSTRTCWFAKFDKSDSGSWSTVLEPTLGSSKIQDLIPCNGDRCKCPFKAEQLARVIAGNKKDYESIGEVNPPCPILVQSTVPVKLREHLHEPDSKIWDMWLEGIEDLNIPVYSPEEPLSKEYLDNITIHGYADEYSNSEAVKPTLDKLVKDELHKSEELCSDFLKRL